MIYRTLLILQVIGLVRSETQDVPTTSPGKCTGIKEMKAVVDATEEQNQLIRDTMKKIDHRMELKAKNTKKTWRRVLDYAVLRQFKYDDGFVKDLTQNTDGERIYLDRHEWGGLNLVEVKEGGVFFKYTIIVDWTSPGYDVTFRFTDKHGDTYKLWCHRTGKHYLFYNSSDPDIVKVRW